MALKDCIKKMESAGMPISADQERALEAAKAEGLSDDQAVRRVVLMANQNIVDITTRARAEGATATPSTNPVSELVKFQAKALDKVATRKTEIKAELNELGEEFQDIVSLENHVTNIQTPGNDQTQMADDGQLLDAMLQMSFATQQDKREALGLMGKDANEMLVGFREMQARKLKVIDEIAALKKEQESLDDQVETIFGGKEQKFYQLEKDAPRLTVQHNMTAGHLKFTDNMGGLAVPSLAIVPQGNNLTGFGEITFIGTGEMGDPAKLPIFDADGYTVRYPSADYKPVKAAIRDPFINELGAWETLWEGKLSSVVDTVNRHIKDRPDPQLVVWKMLDSEAAKAWFLSEAYGEDLTPTMADLEPRFGWGWDKEIMDFFGGDLSPMDLQWDDDRRIAFMKEAGDLVRVVATRHYKRETLPMLGMLNADGTLTGAKFKELVEDVKRKGTQQLDYLSNKALLQARLRKGNRQLEFKRWVEAKIEPMFGEARLKVGNKFVEYNLENITRKMVGKLKGHEFMGDMMTEGFMRAMASHRFARLEEMRQRSETHIDDRQLVEDLRVEASSKINNWIGQLKPFYTMLDDHGYVDQYEMGDDARRALIQWATTKGGMGTANDLEQAMYRQGFSDEMPDWLMDEGLKAGMDWMAVPVPYFEAKPQRSVMLEEFAGVVIPDSASADTRAILLKRGIPFKEYQTGQNIDEIQARLDAVNEFTQQLNNAGENTLFQSEIGVSSAVLAAAKTMPLEEGTAEQMLASLKTQPNVRNKELARIGVEEWANEKGTVTRDELIEFITASNVEDKERGSITFQENAGAIIRLTQAKDLSTFLHESAHLYLEMIGDLIERPGVDPKMIDDYTKILNYLGVNNRREIGVNEHELFARSFEAYLREGKAPTAELQSTFSAVKGWMLLVYSSIKKLLNPGEELTDEIRGVFDRLLATDEAISQSEDMMQYVPLFNNAEDMGISPEAFKVYKSAFQQAHDDAVEDQTQKVTKSLRWADQQWWKTELAKVEAEVRAEAYAMPVYRALAMLQKGKNPDGSEPSVQPFKLSKESVLAAASESQEFLNRLPRPFIYTTKEGGVDVGLAATIFGFGSAKELLQAVMEAPKIETYIKDESNRIMQENHPDALNSPELANDVTRAVHNDKRRQILGAELAALRRRQKADAKIVKATKDTAKREEREAREANAGQVPKGENLAAIKAAAAEIVGAKQIKDINPNTYLQAERKAGRLAFEAMGKKDYAEAYRQRRIQIMNFEAYRAAVRAKEQSVRDRNYLKGFDKKAKRERMGKAGKLEQIEAILEGINLINISGKKIDKINLDRELTAAMEDGSLVIPPEILAVMTHPSGINWRELTFAELSGVRDVVKQLEHQARTDLKVIINDEEVIIQDAVDDVASSIIQNHDHVSPPLADGSGRGAGGTARELVGHWLRSSSIARVLDKSGFGAVTRNIIIPIRRAYTEKLIPRQHKVEEDIAKIYKMYYTDEELGSLTDEIEGSIMGLHMSKAHVLALALNWGTESNRAAILDGKYQDAYGNQSPAYTEQGVAQALSHMDARDWEFVQSMWALENSFYDEMAETQKRRKGIAPQKIEGMKFEIRTVDGDVVTVEGQYHPLRYDPRSNQKAKKDQAEDINRMIVNGGYVNANTRAGATYERTQKHGRVVTLSLGTINSNMRELIRDMTLGDEVNLVNKILQSDDVFNAANNTNNLELLDELKLWLTDAAVGELPAQSVVEKGLSWMRVGFTKSKLAFNVMVTALQLTGVFQSMAVVGSRQYAIGATKFLKNPVANYKMVMEKSTFMHTRYGDMQQWDKDVADTKHFLQGHFGAIPTKGAVAFDKLSHKFFWPIAKAQSVVDVTTWMAAYEKGLNDPEVKSEAEAVIYADSIVENAQTSGLFSDRSGLERGTLGGRTRQGQFVRLWTTLISYMLAKGNIAYEKGAGTDFKDPKQVAAFATDMMLLFMLEGIASALLYGQGPDEDEESLPYWVGKVTIESMTSGIPLLREIHGAKYGSGNTPVGSFFNDAWDFYNQITQGEVDEPLVKSGVKTFGTLFHLPASQTNRFIEALFDEDDTEWYEFLIGTTEDE